MQDQIQLDAVTYTSEWLKCRVPGAKIRVLMPWAAKRPPFHIDALSRVVGGAR